MNKLLIIVLAIGSAFCAVSPAGAATFDGWTVAQIKAHPDFVAYEGGSRFDTTPSLARESAEPGAPFSYVWIGYIWTENEAGDNLKLFFDGNANHVSLSVPKRLNEVVPAWVSPSLDYLVDCRLVSSDGCWISNSPPIFDPEFDPDAKLKELGLQ